MSSAQDQVRLPKGSLIFVTGATGFLGSATVEELCKRGYKVRAATRDISKTTLFAEKLNKLYGEGLFEAVAVPDFTIENAYDAHLEGVDGIVHMATDTSFSPDVNKVVQDSIDGALNIMKAASKVPSIKSLVMTSSRIAVYAVQYGVDGEYPLPETFSDYFYDLALNADDADPSKPVLTYAASKVKAERAAWKYYNEEKPHYAFNTILPDGTLGPISNPLPGRYSTASLLTDLFQGDDKGVITQFFNPPARIVDVRDVALLHVAALIAPDVNGERLWAAAHMIQIDEILKVWREEFPHKKDAVIDTKRSEELLQRFAGRSWIDARTTYVDNVRHAA
ncbi:NAD(P)-binding protein [Cystobasidium minutum MCA 4210]|uniref:NAD(P)-binding protein n=1 Tax=Cystobasidium minutum MCA 4210 TaxID=1397322 RepID=UPI0034CD3F25|eukprot:jgi/Rhomi1/186095/estExt_fgenesh1_pm.C_40381